MKLKLLLFALSASLVQAAQWDIGTAGVRLSDDGDGALTFLGLGDGSDESITWNLDDTANTLTVSSATGVVLIDFSGIALQTTTQSAGDNDTSVATTAFVNTAARDSLTGTHASPSTTTPLSPTWSTVTHDVWYGANGTINLPAAAGYAGRSIIIYSTGSFTITIDPNASEVIVRSGTVQTGGVSMTLTAVAGSYVALICDGVRWITLGSSGTLAVGS